MKFTNLLEIISFTLLQALLSAGLCTVIGLTIGRILFWRTPFWLQNGFKVIGSLTFVTPSLVPSIALMLFNPRLNVFGLGGIVTIHVFLNFAYIAQQINEAYAQGLCKVRHQQADVLRLSWWQRLKLLEWPCLRDEVIHSSFLVFSLALASFTPVLLLGGGPKSTTLSVALYQSLLVDFDPYYALGFIFLQISLSLFAAQAYKLVQSKKFSSPIKPRGLLRPHCSTLKASVVISLLLVILVVPYGLLIKNTVHEASINFYDLFCAVKTTLALAVPIALLVAALSVGAVYGILYRGSNSIKAITDFLLSFPNIALVSGTFILLYPWLEHPFAQAGTIIGIATICYAPYGLKGILARAIGLEQNYKQQIQILRLSFVRTFQIIIWPILGDKLIKVTAVVACFMVGNLSIPLMLGQQEIKTLSVLAYQSAIRFEPGQTSAILLVQLLLMAVIYGCVMGKKTRQGS